MKSLILALALIPSLASAQTLYKVNEDAFFCFGKSHVSAIQEQLDLNVSEDTIVEMINFATSTDNCGFARAGLIGSIQDFHGDFLQLRILNLSDTPHIWVHKNQTGN